MHFTRRGAAGNHALGRLCLLYLDRLYVVDFPFRGCFRYVNRTAAEHRPARCSRRQFCQCHPNRHDRCFRFP
jgi:hypothetical protein